MVRHPSYTGVLLAFVGLALSLHNWAALLVVLLPIGTAFVYRMKVEEEALSRALGSRYTDYEAHEAAGAVRLLKPPRVVAHELLGGGELRFDVDRLLTSSQ